MVKLGTIGVIFNIRPICGIVEVLDSLEKFWKGIKYPNVLAVTFTYTPDIINRLGKISKNVRLICGKLPNNYKQNISGVLVTSGQLHFKGLVAWDEMSTFYYIGSANFSIGSGGDWGIIVTKDEGMNGFRMKASTKNYHEWEDPFEVIFSEIVSRETRSRCELCGLHDEILYLKKGLFVCEKCYR